MLRRVSEDVAAVRERDPAARSPAEVLLCYPGMHALWIHRVAHALWERGHPLAARALATLAYLFTAVDIHPAATVGRRVVIDHGVGVVIGETAEIGDDAHLYHGVTLGGTGRERGKRHPTVGDGVVLGANATVLGPVSVGDGATVGAAAVVLDDVPAGATAVGNPARIVERRS
jgi:serine O-acetyltransferase